MNVLLTKRIRRYLILLTATLLMTACVTTEIPPEDIPPALFSELEENSTYYLNKDNRLGSDENLVWQFLAIQALIKENKFVLANAIVDSLLTKPLTPEQSATLSLLIADKFYAQGKLTETQKALDDSDYQLFNDTSLVHYLTLQSKLHIENNLPFEASESLLLLAPLLTKDEQKQSNNDLILAQLILLPSEDLASFVPEENDLVTPQPEESTEQTLDTLTTDIVDVVTQTKDIIESQVTSQQNNYQIDPEFKAGWYALALIYQQYQLRPNRLNRELKDWETKYSSHSTLAFMPLVLTNLSTISPYQPDNIAVLLPLTGRFEKQGKAIQLGLLNAYYLQQKTLESDGKLTPKLHFFDTQTMATEQLASEIKQANIDFVIGPLIKQEIEDLLPLLGKLPVLALNRFSEKLPTDSDINSDNTTPNADEQLATSDEDELLTIASEDKHVPWHYAFPLSPEDEARQAATMILNENHKYPLIIAPKSNYGTRVAEAFKDQWEKSASDQNKQVEAHYFQSTSELADFMEDVLQTGQSKRRIAQMKSIIGGTVETEVRSRRDVDAIYIVSKRDELILIKPFIDVSVSPFAKKITLYASSRSHSEDRFNMQNKELTGLVFSDTSFLLNQYPTLSDEVEKAWGKQAFSTLRVFALGFDSYQLIEQLVALQNNENAIYKGLVGDITLDAGNNIDAKLSWAKYQNGALFEVATPISAE